MNKVTIVVADDHPLIRRGLRALLESRKGYEVIGEAADGKELIKLCRELNPDIALVDIGMPALNGLDAARQIKSRQPQIKIIVISVHSGTELITAALEAGISGYLLKKSSADEFAQAIAAALSGKVFLSSEISTEVVSSLLRKAHPDSRPLPALTPRERSVLGLIAEGFSSEAIAAELKISKRTVESCRSEIMSKLDLHSVATLVKYAIRHGLTSVDK